MQPYRSFFLFFFLISALILLKDLVCVLLRLMQVFMMDPWSNPAIEQQAQDRVHRIGQYKPIRRVPLYSCIHHTSSNLICNSSPKSLVKICRVVKFVIEDTIEERILKLQERNESVYKGYLLATHLMLINLNLNYLIIVLPFYRTSVGGSGEDVGRLTEADIRFLLVI